jgi:LPS-assembly protein
VLGAATLLCGAIATAADKSSQSHIPPEVAAQHQSPIEITGDKTIYDSARDSFTVLGHAVMTQGATVLTADQITVMRKQRTARAVGHVHLTDPEAEIWASRAEVDLNNETLELDDAKVLAKRNTYHLEGKQIRKEHGQRYVVVKGFFTTCGCEPGTPDWSFTADQMDVHMGDTGYARNARFSVLGYPVVPLPYAEFPADTSRHSGFLSGREGQSGLRGFQYLQPYYLAINKSSDATVALDVETSQRIGGLGEYRLANGPDDYLWADAAYYNESIRSNANRLTDIVDNQIADPSIPVDRYGIIAMTRQHLTPDLTAYGDTVTVSDSLYLREMDVWTLSRGFGTNFGSMRDAESHLGMIGEFDDGFARLQGTWHEDLIQDQRFALQQLPELWVSGRRDVAGGFAYLDYDVWGDDYWRRAGIAGTRLSVNPRLTVPWRIGDYLYGYFAGGGWGNVYDASGHQVSVVPVGAAFKGQILTFNNQLKLGPLAEGGLNTRWIPYFQTGVGTEFERVYDLNWKYIEKLKHTVEPFVSYTYVPEISQSSVPLWDERDRINGRSLVVYGFTTRLFARMNSTPSSQEVAENPGAEAGAVRSADAGQTSDTPYGGESDGVYDGTNAAQSHGAGGSTTRELVALTLMQAYDTTHAVSNDGISLSDVQGVFTLFPTSVVSFGSQFAYDPRTQPGISYASVELNLQPPWNSNESRLYMGKALQGSFLQASYNYVRSHNAVQSGTARNSVEFFALRAYYDLFDRMGLYFAPNYDLAASRMLSMQYGARLKSPCDCWAFDVGVTDSFNPNEVQVQVQLTLGGLGSIGQSPFGRNPFAVMGLAGRSAGVLPTY